MIGVDQETKQSTEQEVKLQQFIGELNTLKETYKQQIWSILNRYGKWLASLDKSFLTEVIVQCSRKGLCTEEQIRKAVMVAQEEMPLHIARSKQITIDWWNKVPSRDKAILTNPTARIPIQRGNAVDEILVSKIATLRRDEVKKIIAPDKPELGILKPGQSVPEKGTKSPIYWNITNINVIGNFIVISSQRNNIKIKSRLNINDISKSDKKALLEVLK